MKFGMLSRNGRGGMRAAESWDEDLWDIVTADKLGFQEAWISEHLLGRSGGSTDGLGLADLFICKAAALTEQIRLGPGIRNLPYFHPVMVAIEAATTDHLTGGRYNAGWGGAAPGNQFEQLGYPREGSDKRAMMHEAIDLILKCWESTEPFDYNGQFWNGRDIFVQPKPLQQPRIPVGLASSTATSTVQLAGERGFFPIHSAFEGPEHMRRLDEAFVAAAERVGRPPCRKEIRILRVVHVAASDDRAREEIRPWLEPKVEESLTLTGGAPSHIRAQLPPGLDIEDVDMDYLIESGLLLVGSPDSVYEKIINLYERQGGFGVLLFNVGTGGGIGPRELRLRSWTLFMEEVAPALTSLNPDASAVV